MRETDSGTFPRLSGKELMVKHLRSFMEKYDEVRKIRGFQINAEIEFAVDTFRFEAGEGYGEEWATQFQEMLEIYVEARGVPEDAQPIVSSEEEGGVDFISHVDVMPPTGVVAEKGRMRAWIANALAKLRGA